MSRVRCPSNIFSPQARDFYFLHRWLMREDLDLQYRDIRPTLPFYCNLELVIDGCILPAIFVGNDLLPNLPDWLTYENGDTLHYA